MSSKLLLNLQERNGTLSQQLVTGAAEVLRYELGSENFTADTVTLTFYDGTDDTGTVLGTVDIPANTDVDTSPVTGTPGWSASDGLYVEVTAGDENWVNGQSFVDVATADETDIRRVADVGSSLERFDLTLGSASFSDTNWNTRTWDSSKFLGGALQSSGVQNDEIVFRVLMKAGTWKVSLTHSKGASRGIYTVQFDGTAVGTIDGYNASNVNAYDTITGITVVNTRIVAVKLLMATKNASSSSFFGLMSALSGVRTGA